MKPSTLSGLAVMVIVSFALLTLLGSPIVQAVTTTLGNQQTVTGYNAPNANNFMNGIGAFLLPLFFAELFGALLIALHRTGDFFVTLYLFGLALGASFGTLGGMVPIAMTIIAWVLLVLWWWSGGQGEGSSASGDSDLRLPKGWR